MSYIMGSCSNGYGYPYTNMQNANLDWIIDVVKRVEDISEGQLNENMIGFIHETFDKLMPTVAYDKQTETLIFTMKEREVNE